MELDQSQARKGSSQETIDVQSRDNARAVEGYSRQPRRNYAGRSRLPLGLEASLLYFTSLTSIAALQHTRQPDRHFCFVRRELPPSRRWVAREHLLIQFNKLQSCETYISLQKQLLTSKKLLTRELVVL